MLHTYEYFFICIWVAFYQHLRLQIMLYVDIKCFEDVSFFYGFLDYFQYECISNSSKNRIAALFVERFVSLTHKCLNCANTVSFIFFVGMFLHRN